MRELSYGRAVWTFLLAYVVITVVAIGFSLAIQAAMHNPENGTALSPSYQVAQRFFPVMNLVVWMGFAWVYFRKRQRSKEEAVTLGVFWVLSAVVVDYVGFVLIKNPISLSPHDFYVGQAPWIYLIYVAILVSPLGVVRLSKKVLS